MLTVPWLEVKSDWRAAHDRLLDDFPEVTEVLATTMPATLLIVHEGDADVDAWLATVSEAILSRRLRSPRGAGCMGADRQSSYVLGNSSERVGRPLDQIHPSSMTPTGRNQA
jgi:hypothetical protein